MEDHGQGRGPHQNDYDDPHHDPHHGHRYGHPDHPYRRLGVPRFRGFLGRWFAANVLLSGLLALLWLILRSGTKPSRLTYPCQRAAIGTAAAAFGAPVVAAILAARRRLVLWMRMRAALTVGILGLALTASLAIVLSRASDSSPVASVARLAPPADYRAQLYHVTGCAQDPAGDHFLGLSDLLVTMGRGGLKFYRSDEVSPLGGPAGIVAPNDVVVVKINYQWDQRGGTNTDLLRGLIRTILDHPDGFTGEVVVCENAQFNSTSNFDRALNNAQDHSLSPHDVVAAFQAQGCPVSQYDWTVKRTVQVAEYSAGDMNDGYVVEPYDARWQGKLSYAKFCTTLGTYISIRYGVWDPLSHTYDRTRLKFINVPVLKSHHATYGATVSTKHYMGVVTDQFSTNSHNSIRVGIMGALMSEIQTADLNIVDAIWINANPLSGPQTSYSGATRRDELVAGLDPIATDIWSVKNILIPGFIGNGYSPPWPNPSADPDLPSSAFRTYLDNSMNMLLTFGHQVTNDYGQIDVTNGKGAAGDFDGNGTVDMADYAAFAACFTGEGGGPVGPECSAGDFDGDGDVDCHDWELFRAVWTDSQPIPDLPVCDLADARGGSGSGSGAFLRLSPNPMGESTRIAYSLTVPGPVRVSIHDVAGRLVRVLADRSEQPGDHAITWDGHDASGAPVVQGVYTVLVESAVRRVSEKLVVRR